MHKKTHAPARPNLSASPDKPSYEPPRLRRVRIETTRLGYGVVDAVNNCTAHSHDDNAGVCT